MGATVVAVLALVGTAFWYVKGLHQDITDLTESSQVLRKNNEQLNGALAMSNNTINAMVVERANMIAVQAQLHDDFRHLREANRILQDSVSNLSEELLQMSPNDAKDIINRQTEMLNLCIEKLSKGDADADEICDNAAAFSGSVQQP